MPASYCRSIGRLPKVLGQHAERARHGTVDTTVSIPGAGLWFGQNRQPGGADFSNATFSETDFASVDLTGAKFKVPANFSGGYWITLLYGITCPDGAPPGGGVQNYRACRIGK